ncbi:hypothetical protein GCM10023347_49310 [Streptomyces chumphonensis]|uniref:TetR/AcrR family transcriptional regulator n=1 Tax=Streptomyces chumphonensis TaxID=1214925 RepID=A0A927F235_9ACTN|nr:TetR/AcrR family transcriptional regulator [Streptomyces chumphonensis]MBD3933297.1 TetR/AcrR family transcriptional regulator [Streptomyces chumphonensis]
MSPATSKGNQRRTALLDTARRILLTSGGAELTMRAVADAAGIRLGHLQYYFPSRSDLLAALLERILADSLERIAALTPNTEGHGGAKDRGTDGECCEADAGPALESILADHDDPDLIRLFTEVWAMAAHDTQAAEAVTAFYAAYVEQLTAFIRERAPQTGPEEARSRAEVFVMLMEGASLFRSGVAGRPTAPTEALLRQMLLNLMEGSAA